ncbi:gliding motility-associated peptidyl-prolyl isomerase GldI [Allomuricauda sp. SCSIO 65647]|uniref:gliding motility-associated peptidyl-prolyl isomerase GldI n=1 Tax=Allomuricauda sp. SCSIO 65647 TaxID=2908843 RepID=UPI001F2C3ABE|nr:gliding motility-associated peptidyl-prolyl isomerase GldI [Muricauda sp. SCSIO 65647]UJH67902.1 gliding motility-associated peptidyl-prolyl isomerase GldI [Muricauda sp. SCSIO 65647]
MKRSMITLVLLLAITSCKQPEPRRPVKVKSGSFFTETVERNKKILAQEEALIRRIIEKDTANDYHQSASGFWFQYQKKNDTATYLPRPEDGLLLSYNIVTMANDTIYTEEEIGLVPYIVDKQQLFPGLRYAVKLLKEGERAAFLFPSSLGYGYHGDNNKIAPLTPIRSTIEIHEIKKQQSSINQNK